MARLFSLIPLLCFAWTSIVQALPFHNINLPDSPKPILMHGNKSIAPAMIGGFVSECIAEFMMPTHGTDKRASHERPDYTKSQQAIVHGIAKLAPVLICAACGMNDAQISVAVNAATMALAYNHGKSVDKARKKGRANEAGEDEKEDDNSTPKTTPALTINGTEFDLMDHQPNHPGLRKRSLSLTSLYLAEKKEQARANYRAAKTSAEKDIALSRALNADVELANRPAVKATHQATDYVRDNPGKTSAYIEATLLSGGAVLAQNLTAGIFLGAAGGFIGSMASHDFSINSGKDAASIAVSTVLGGLIPAPAKLFFPAALATGVYGMNTHDSDLMWEGGLGAAFSFVPLVKEGRHSFNTGKNITVGGAHFSRSLDDSMLRPPVNSNMPIKPPANTNVMPLPHVVEPIEVNGLQKLAQELSGGAKTTKDYRQIYFSAERSRAQGLGSNGTLTLDGGTRTLNASKTASGKLVLDSSGNSGSLGVFRQNSEGRWLLSAGERVSAKDLVQRPVDLIETTERTLASYQKMKAGRASTTSTHSSSHLLESNTGRYVPGIAHNSSPLVDSSKLLRGTQGNAGNIPSEIAKMMEGRTFTSFDNFRNEFWKAVSSSKYASEFGKQNITKMSKGFAPTAHSSQQLGERVSYELHHTHPIHKGGSVYDLSNMTIVTPRYHKEVLAPKYHYNK